MPTTDDERFDAFVDQMRAAMGEAIAAMLRFTNVSYREAWTENARLKKRNEYLEQRVTELEQKEAA